MREVRLYFDGDPELKSGLHALFREAVEEARSRRVRLRFIAGEGQAVGDFMKALRSHPESLNLLLVDAEGPDDGKLFSKLKGPSNWKPPQGTKVGADRVLWMVQCMETWFIADREALRAYYGAGFNSKSLPSNQDVEAVPKDDLLAGLKTATRRTQKGPYHKTRHAPDLLARVSPDHLKKTRNFKRAIDLLVKAVRRA